MCNKGKHGASQAYSQKGAVDSDSEHIVRLCCCNTAIISKLLYCPTNTTKCFYYIYSIQITLYR